MHEYRGRSWSIGGDANATTLPNYIKAFNPNVTGYSIGRREGSLCWGPVCRDVHRKRHDILNGALSGAMIRNGDRTRFGRGGGEAPPPFAPIKEGKKPRHTLFVNQTQPACLNQPTPNENTPYNSAFR